MLTESPPAGTVTCMDKSWENLGYPSFRATLAEQVNDVVSVPQDPLLQIELLRSMVPAKLDEPVLVDVEVATRMVRPYTWLLDQVGDGIKLTAAGFLPPKVVEATVAELGLGDEWIGKHNRENQTLPVLELRESAMKTGLLRKERGILLPTRSGRSVRSDPVKLWWDLAANVPPRRAQRLELQATVLLLTAVAAQLPEEPLQFATGWLEKFGYGFRDGSPMTKWTAKHSAETACTILLRTGAIERGEILQPDRVTSQGALFARAALRTWPKPSR
jgi:hypothetical protein